MAYMPYTMVYNSFFVFGKCEVFLVKCCLSNVFVSNDHVPCQMSIVFVGFFFDKSLCSLSNVFLSNVLLSDVFVTNVYVPRQMFLLTNVYVSCLMSNVFVKRVLCQMSMFFVKCQMLFVKGAENSRKNVKCVCRTFLCPMSMFLV